MKKLKCTDPSSCAFCLSCEVACSEAFYKTFDPALSCIHITTKDGKTPKVNVCVQCGKCARTCPNGAITQNAKGVYSINKKLCTQCGKCAEICPFHVLVKVPEQPASKCIACGICVKACPMEILEIVEK